MKTYHSFSSRETEAHGEALGKDVMSSRVSAGLGRATVVALQGNLGAGKTTFVRGFFRGLGLKKRAQSPTFIIMRRHSLKRKFKNVFHMDAYRLKSAEQLEALEFGKIMDDPKNIILIEWPERIKKALPANTAWITFRHGKKENERSIIMKHK